MTNRNLEKREHSFNKDCYVSITTDNLDREKKEKILQMYEKFWRTIEKLFVFPAT